VESVGGKTIAERDWLSQVLDLAHLYGWVVAHFRPGMNRRGSWSTPVQGDGVGFPDLVLLRPPELIVAELKTNRGKVTREQAVWIDSFSACGIESYVWRPAQFDQISARLRRRRLSASNPNPVFPLCRMGFHQRCSSPVQCGCECHTAERTRQ